MLQEQNFADNFLTTAPARRCIGQACRTGIVTPLIETMTEESESVNESLGFENYVPLAAFIHMVKVDGGGGEDGE